MTVHMINREKLIIEVETNYMGYPAWDIAFTSIDDLHIIVSENDEEKTSWTLEA